MDDLAAGDPSHIGRYRLLGRLGAGGTGRVYLARSPAGRAVAVKLIWEDYARPSEFRARFADEVKAARQVDGEWTAHVLDADPAAEIPWVATAYVAGPSLRDVVDRDFGPLPEPSLLVLAHRLASALADIHRAGLVHRDLKPSHVLLAMGGPRVIDFGITAAPISYANTGPTVGTPGFMPPEQLRGEPVGPAGDVFCLGAVLAYAATGRLPFGEPGGGIPELFHRVAHEEPDLVGVPAPLLPVVRACLHKDPERRPTPEQIRGHLADGRPADPWLPREVMAQVARHTAVLRETGLPGVPRRQYAPPVPEDGYRPDPPPPLPSAPTPGWGSSLPRAGHTWGPPRRRRRTVALLAALAVLALVAAWFVVRAVV